MTGARQVVGLIFVATILPFTARGAADRFAAQSDPAGRQEISAADRAKGLGFLPGVPPSHQQAIFNAIQAARPEAQRLIAIVDGRVKMTVGPAGGTALGLTEAGPGIEGYRVTVDLEAAYERHGTRGISRLVLHELGHVIDHALLTGDVARALDAGIPPGVGCDEGVTGGCAIREERFAETFAKWATNDVGFNLYIGYKVPPPPSLDAWGAPLESVSS